MQISQLYVYPIKSLRETSLRQAELTKHGFRYDRYFVLLKPSHDGPSMDPSGERYENMMVSSYPQMTLFLTELQYPEAGFQGSVIVTFNPPDGETRSLTIPLQSETSALEPVNVDLHNSRTKGYNMGDPYNTWFSTCFGFPVILVRLGSSHRRVLFQFPPNTQPNTSPSWLSTLTSTVLSSAQHNPSTGVTTNEEQITFADHAPYLVITESSLSAATSRLPSDSPPMDARKFRPNIILSGGAGPWDEDFWAELEITTANGSRSTLAPRRNCIRCCSINLDFDTGKPGTGPAGQMLKLLQKDRRVDPGQKWSPVFGRYCFLEAGEGVRIAVGDEVVMTKKSAERAVFDWQF